MRYLLPLFILGLVSCSSVPAHLINEKYRAVLTQRDTSYHLKPGDILNIRFYNQDVDLNQALMTVLPDGRTDPYFMDDVVVAGKSVKELEADIVRYYARQVRVPEVSVQVTPAAEAIIIEGQFGGQSRNIATATNIIPYTSNMTLVQAIGRVGGYNLTACMHEVVIRRYYLDPKHPDVFRINLRDYADTPEDLILLPGDQIILERNWFILFRDYVDEYVWGMLPPFFRTMPITPPIW